MDKWKDIELEKMKVGGNRNGKVFLEGQPDWDKKASMSDRYNSKAAALYRDKVSFTGTPFLYLALCLFY
jgi:ADP-ribosylation factor GTPase-activating protein 1